jgi:hypothetical protein
MPTTYPCPTDPVPPESSAPLVDPVAALHLVTAALHPVPRPETVAVWLDADRKGIGLIVVDGAESPDDIVRLAKVLAASATPGGAAEAVLFATHRPGWGPEVDDCDTRCFDIVDDLLAEAGIDLIDWFQMDGGLAVSMAEHLGLRSRWEP